MFEEEEEVQEEEAVLPLIPQAYSLRPVAEPVVATGNKEDQTKHCH